MIMNTTTQVSPTQKCYQCGSNMQGRRENYRYTECGLSSVVLQNILVFHCKCGSIVPEILGIDGLHIRLMRNLLAKSTLLSGEEIRFLRKMAGSTASKLAKTLGVAKETVSRWENDKSTIGGESDRLLRFACFFEFMQQRKFEEKDRLDDALDRIREMTSLNLPEVFRQMTDCANGSKPMTINPETLAQFGSDVSESGDPSQTVQ